MLRLWFYGKLHTSDQGTGAFVTALALPVTTRNILEAVKEVILSERSERCFLLGLAEKGDIEESRTAIEEMPVGMDVYPVEPVNNRQAEPLISVVFSGNDDPAVLAEQIHDRCQPHIKQSESDDRKRSNLPKFIEALRDFDRFTDWLDQEAMNITLPSGFHRFGNWMERPGDAPNLIEVDIAYTAKRLSFSIHIVYDSPEYRPVYIQEDVAVAVKSNTEAQPDSNRILDAIELTLSEAEHLTCFLQSWFRGFSINIMTRLSSVSK